MYSFAFDCVGTYNYLPITCNYQLPFRCIDFPHYCLLPESVRWMFSLYTLRQGLKRTSLAIAQRLFYLLLLVEGCACDDIFFICLSKREENSIIYKRVNTLLVTSLDISILVQNKNIIRNIENDKYTKEIWKISITFSHLAAFSRNYKRPLYVNTTQSFRN